MEFMLGFIGGVPIGMVILIAAILVMSEPDDAE
jgi:hypothetical protein